MKTIITLITLIPTLGWAQTGGYSEGISPVMPKYELYQTELPSRSKPKPQNVNYEDYGNYAAKQQEEVQVSENQTEEKPTVTEKEGGDTYNFYFQKGNAPNKVEQGSTQKVEAQEPPPPQSSNATPAPIPEYRGYEFPRFEAIAEIIVTRKSSGAGGMLGGQFNISPTFGLQAHLLSITNKTEGPYSSFSASGSYDGTIEHSTTGADFAAVWSPIKFNQGYNPVRLSFLAGVMLLKTELTSKGESFTASGSNEWETPLHEESATLGFIGMGATARIGQQWGLTGNLRVATKADYSQIGLGGVWLF